LHSPTPEGRNERPIFLLSNVLSYSYRDAIMAGMNFRCISMLALALATVALPAAAAGTVRVQQSDGSVQVYRGAAMDIIGKTLRVTSADGKGTLLIDRAACTYNGDIQVCLLYHVVLDQGGAPHPIDLATGTAYVNLTSSPQQLALSSTKVQPNGILIAMRTKAGTYISMSGSIDSRSK
jgi:hypothetical protein